jgi:membrane-bound ClpP family serine protease
MRKVKTLAIIFTFWILLIILSAAWLIFLVYNNYYLISINLIYLAVLIIACFAFLLSMFFIFQVLIDVRIQLKKAKQKERNMKDILQYDQVIDPPSIYN